MRVASGDYRTDSTLVITRPYKVQGSWASDFSSQGSLDRTSKIIDALETGDTITVTITADAEFSNFLVKGAWTNGVSRAISITNGASPNIHDNDIDAGFGSDTRGIVADRTGAASVLKIHRNRVFGGNATGWSFGITIDNATSQKTVIAFNEIYGGWAGTNATGIGNFVNYSGSGPSMLIYNNVILGGYGPGDPQYCYGARCIAESNATFGAAVVNNILVQDNANTQDIRFAVFDQVNARLYSLRKNCLYMPLSSDQVIFRSNNDNRYYSLTDQLQPADTLKDGSTGSFNSWQNINADPKFIQTHNINTAEEFFSCDFALQAGSPAISQGNNLLDELISYGINMSFNQTPLPGAGPWNMGPHQ